MVNDGYFKWLFPKIQLWDVGWFWGFPHSTNQTKPTFVAHSIIVFDVTLW